MVGNKTERWKKTGKTPTQSSKPRGDPVCIKTRRDSFCLERGNEGKRLRNGFGPVEYKCLRIRDDRGVGHDQ